MDGSRLIPLLVSLVVSLILASVVRVVACRMSLYARRPDTGDPVPLLGGVALVGGALAGLFSSGGSIGVIPLLVCSLLMAALGLIRDLWPLRTATFLVGQFIVAALIVQVLPPVRLVGEPVLDTLLALGWIVALGGMLTTLERWPRVALVAAALAALVALAAGIAGQSAPVGRALIPAAGAACGLLIYTVAVRPLLSGHAGTLFVGGWLASAALLASESQQASQTLATGAPVAGALLALQMRSWRAGRPVATPAAGWSTSRLFANRGHEVLLDAAVVAASYYAGFGIRFDEPQFSQFLPYFAKSLPAVLGCQLAALWLVGKYHRLRFVPAITDAVMITKGVVFGVASAVILLLYLYRFEGFSRQVFAMHGGILAFLLIGYPMVIGGADSALKPRRRARKVLIYGAGRAGALLLRELLQNEELGATPVGFIDDDPANRRLKLDGFPVLGTVGDLPAILVRQTVSEVLISMKHLPPTRLAALTSACREHGVRIRRMRLTLEEVEPAAATTQEQQSTASTRMVAESQVTRSSSSSIV